MEKREPVKVGDTVMVLETIVAGYSGKVGKVENVHEYNDGKQVTRIEVLFKDGKKLFIPYFNVRKIRR